MEPQPNDFGRGNVPARCVEPAASRGCTNRNQHDGEPERKERDYRLTPTMKAFVRDCIDTQRPLADVMDDHNVTPERFARWLDNPLFRRHLERMCKSTRRAREVDIAIGARKAAELLRRNTNPDGKPPLTDVAQVKASESLIKLARSSESQRRGERMIEPDRRRRDLTHPDLSPQETNKLLKLMDEAANG
jgi:hypothetical protein